MDFHQQMERRLKDCQDNHRQYDYDLVRTNKETGEKHNISFTCGILHKMDVTENEWKEV